MRENYCVVATSEAKRNGAKNSLGITLGAIFASQCNDLPTAHHHTTPNVEA